MDENKTPEELMEEMGREIEKVFAHFAPGGKFGPIEDPEEYERLTGTLPPLERELNREVTNFIHMVDYCGRKKIKLDSSFADAMFAAAKLPVVDRIPRVREINQMLLKRLDDAGQADSFRM
jgi:hypothetical protein